MNTPVAPQLKRWIPIPKKWEKINFDTDHEADFADFVPKLVAALQNDFTIQEACDYAGLSRRTFYNHLKSDPSFAEEMRKAKDFPKIAAKKRAMHIINTGSDREAGPMARWLLEKRQPEVYGNKPIVLQNNQQNNYYSLSNEEIRKICERPDVANCNPLDLLKALEATSEQQEQSKPA